jgi:hypothetical protein
MGFLEVIGDLPHQNVLVGRRELRAAFLMTAIELVHLLLLQFDSEHESWPSTTSTVPDPI